MRFRYAIYASLALSLGGYLGIRAFARHCDTVPLLDASRVDLHVVSAPKLDSPTRIAAGPGGLLYIAERHGLIHVLEPGHEARPFQVQPRETITAIQQIPNHNDDGEPNPNIRTRLVTGLIVTGTPADPVLWVASSDPRIGDRHTDSNSGIISRLTRSAGEWRRTDIVRGLPRSKYDHATNGLWLDDDSQTLYFLQGGNTNAGAPSADFHNLPEFALSAALLAVDLARLGPLPYDLPTLDDECRPGNPDANDPFGGSAGDNQAMLLPGGPVTLYATGLRNAYDLTPAPGGFYVADNGANQGYGGRPHRDAKGLPTNQARDGGDHAPGALRLVAPGGFYGHVNPTRQNPEIRFKSADSAFPPGPLQHRSPPPPLAELPASTNGIESARHAGLGARDAVLTVDLKGNVVLWSFPAPGTPPVRETLATTGRTLLDLAVQPAVAGSPGTTWLLDYSAGELLAMTRAPASPMRNAARQAEVECCGLTLAMRSEWWSWQHALFR